MARLKSRCPDAPLLRLVNRFLKAGVSVGGQVVPTHLGVPQGGPLSPVLANVVLDELDWELSICGTLRPANRGVMRPAEVAVLAVSDGSVLRRFQASCNVASGDRKGVQGTVE